MPVNAADAALPNDLPYKFRVRDTRLCAGPDAAGEACDAAGAAVLRSLVQAT
jgi:hypothetical protein